MITAQHYLILACLLFVIGLMGVFIRKNILILVLSLELTFTGVILGLATGSWLAGSWLGSVAIAFVVTVAATEAAVALALVLVLNRHKQSVSSTAMETLEG